MWYKIGEFLRCLANWIDGSGWDYDEFDHGFEAGLRTAQARKLNTDEQEASKMNVIDFPRPPQGSASYIDREAIEAACEALEQEVGAIVIGSQEEFDTIDPLAYEINSHVLAIRRAIAVVAKQDGLE